MERTNSAAFQCVLKARGFLRRRLEVTTPEGLFEVEYRGLGLGYEQVLVNGDPAAVKQSFIWFCPKFDFPLGSLLATLEVRVWIYFQVKRFTLIVDGQTIYQEG